MTLVARQPPLRAKLVPLNARQMLTPGMNRLLSLVFAAAVLPLLGLYALLISISTPSSTGGMEPTVTTICYIAFTFIFGALIIVSINFSRQLSRQAKGQLETP